MQIFLTLYHTLHLLATVFEGLILNRLILWKFVRKGFEFCFVPKFI
jgi:hypothetical protein